MLKTLYPTNICDGYKYICMYLYCIAMYEYVVKVFRSHTIIVKYYFWQPLEHIKVNNNSEKRNDNNINNNNYNNHNNNNINNNNHDNNNININNNKKTNFLSFYEPSPPNCGSKLSFM